MLVTGEASGDIAAKQVIETVCQMDPCVTFMGIGGPLAKAAGLRVLYPCDKLAVIGLTAVFRQFRAIWQAMRVCKQTLRQEKPDALVLIDYPGFNLRLARYAKRCGIPVWYYISPKIWVWKANRIHTLAATVSHMAVIFPFEVPLYEQAQIPVTLVTHPSITQVKTTLGPGIIRQQLAIPENAGLITLMPGSRSGEVQAHLPILCAAAEQIRQQVDCHFVIPIANTINLDTVRAAIPTSLSTVLHLTTGNTYDTIAASDQVIAASGTATLEVALLGTPLCAIYVTSWLSYHLAKRIIKIPYISLPNIVTNQPIIPEFIQADANPTTIANWAIDMQQHPKKRQAMRLALQSVRVALGASTSRISAGEALMNFLESI
jgi:lipid-A-disaccharide synthase